MEWRASCADVHKRSSPGRGRGEGMSLLGGFQYGGGRLSKGGLVGDEAGRCAGADAGRLWISVSE